MNYYDILGLNKNASKDDIKKAYKKLVLKWHPDKNINNKKQADEQFKKISEAYYTLSDDCRKGIYDNSITHPNVKANNNNNKWSPENKVSAEDIFKNFFGTSNIFDICDDNKFFSIERKKPSIATYNLLCTLEELHLGTKKTVIIRNKTIIVDVQPGWKQGTKITFQNHGVLFVIKEKQHSVFKRLDNNLTMTLVISLTDALKGFQKGIKLLDGSIYNLQIPRITDSKYVHTIAGKGMIIRKQGIFKGYGDLIIDFNISL